MDEKNTGHRRCHLTLFFKVKHDLEDNLTTYRKHVLYSIRYSASWYADAQPRQLTEANASVQAPKADSAKL
jgi:hypothetical protein